MAIPQRFSGRYSLSANKSYSQILKSSSLVGGGQLVRMFIGIISTKFVAVLVGPAGVGLIGAFQSISGLGLQICGLGINQSGVRDVATVAGSGDKQSVARTISILRRMCWLTGTVGALGLAVFAGPISRLTFGNCDHATDILILSFVIFVTAISQGQIAVIQGLRRISDLVRVQIFGSIAGLMISICLYATIGMDGIVPALIALALFNLLASWWYSRKLFSQSVPMSWRETLSGAKSLVGLGTAFMVGGLAVTFTAYATRALITRDIGMQALGMYQAAFAISGYILNFVLGAMGADFYPRLAGVCEDKRAMIKLVNEQTEIGLLLATPVLVAILGLAPLAIDVLYTAEFAPATELLRWFVMGCFLRVIAWPLGFIQLAKGEKYWFMGSELVFAALHILLIYWGLFVFGLRGSAMAFFALYVVYVVVIYFIACHLINFTWSSAAKRLIFTQVSLVTLVFVLVFILPELWSMGIGTVFAVVTCIHSLRQLLFRLGEDHRVCRLVISICGKRLSKILFPRSV